MRIDAHQHYWSLGLGHNNWPTAELPAIFRDFGPQDLTPLLRATGIDRTVLVQASPDLRETEFLLDLADREETVAAVVGWVDILAEDVALQLERLCTKPKFRGIRPMLQGIADTSYILQARALDTLRLLSPLGLRFDALVQPRHLPVIAALADLLPDLPIVIDHAAKPFIAAGTLEPWRADLSALALRSNVWVKLSGLLTEAGDDWTVEAVRPYVRHLIDSFGPSRMMFGSDWPVLGLAVGYEAWHALALDLVSDLEAHEQEDIFGHTAARFYGLSTK